MTDVLQFDLQFMCWSFPVCHHKDTDPEEEQTKGLIVGILTVLEDDNTVIIISNSKNVLNVEIYFEFLWRNYHCCLCYI